MCCIRSWYCFCYLPVAFSLSLPLCIVSCTLWLSFIVTVLVKSSFVLLFSEMLEYKYAFQQFKNINEIWQHLFEYKQVNNIKKTKQICKKTMLEPKQINKIRYVREMFKILIRTTEKLKKHVNTIIIELTGFIAINCTTLSFRYKKISAG